MFARFHFLCLLVLLLVAGSSEAWTPGQSKDSSLKRAPKDPSLLLPTSWIAASAAVVPVFQVASMVHAMDGGGSSMPMTSVTVSEFQALQIPLLGGYFAMALWALPKAVKSLKQNESDRERN